MGGLAFGVSCDLDAFDESRTRVFATMHNLRILHELLYLADCSSWADLFCHRD